jgi:hypothetical protein
VAKSHVAVRFGGGHGMRILRRLQALERKVQPVGRRVSAVVRMWPIDRFELEEVQWEDEPEGCQIVMSLPFKDGDDSHDEPYECISTWLENERGCEIAGTYEHFERGPRKSHGGREE